MKRCGRARDLFGPYWDDEVTRAEREWLEAHFQACPDCRAGYEQFARTLEAMATLPRAEAAPDLAARALAAARRAAPAPDVIFVRETPRWVPVTAAAVALVLVAASIAPYLAGMRFGAPLAGRVAAVPEARLVPARVSGAEPVSGTIATAVMDSLFDHSEDVDFVLDPVNPREGRAAAGMRLPGGVQAEQTVITF